MLENATSGNISGKNKRFINLVKTRFADDEEVIGYLNARLKERKLEPFNLEEDANAGSELLRIRRYSEVESFTYKDGKPIYLAKSMVPRKNNYRGIFRTRGGWTLAEMIELTSRRRLTEQRAFIEAIEKKYSGEGESPNQEVIDYLASRIALSIFPNFEPNPILRWKNNVQTPPTLHTKPNGDEEYYVNIADLAHATGLRPSQIINFTKNPEVKATMQPFGTIPKGIEVLSFAKILAQMGYVTEADKITQFYNTRPSAKS